MELQNRKRLRLQGYDYRQNGAYFITICTKNKDKLLCDIEPTSQATEPPIVTLTPMGKIVDEAIRKIPGIDKYVIMPNHVHLILWNQDQGNVATKIKVFKNVVAGKSGRKIWQTSYYDHVIRDDSDFLIKWKYIDDNPAKWASDEYYES